MTKIVVDSNGIKWLVKDGKKIQNLGSVFPTGSVIKNLTVSKNKYGGKNILNEVNYQNFQGTSGRDLLRNKGVFSFVNGAGGDDTIKNYANQASLSGGSGKDYIATAADTKGVTIYGGSGNDTLVGGSKYGDVYEFGNYDGNDIILGYGTNDTIFFTNIWEKSEIKYSISGSDKIIYTNRSGGTQITVKNAASKKVTVKYGYSGVLTIDGSTTSTYTPSTSTYTPSTSTYTPSTSTYTPSTSTYTPSTSTYTPSTSTYTPSTSTYTEPVTISGTTMTVSGKPTADILLGGKTPAGKYNYTHYSSTVTDIDASGMTAKKVLAGNSNNNSIVSGSGGGTVWGGSGGNDTMVGGAGRDVFFYASGNGNDTVEKFYTGNKYFYNSDILVINQKINRITRDDKEVVFTMTDGGKLTVMTDVLNVDFALNYSSNAKSFTGVKIGNTYSSNSFTYDAAGTKHYYGGYTTDTLKITGSASNNINLSKSNFSDIEVIDASNATGKNTLIGDSGRNTLKAGTGTTRLWGNSGYNNDTLIGNDGTDHFYYGKNQGDDVIQNAGSGDYVRLYNIRQSDVSSYSNTDSGFKLNVGSGSLTVDKTDGVTFVFKGGARYTYNAGTDQFRRA